MHFTRCFSPKDLWNTDNIWLSLHQILMWQIKPNLALYINSQLWCSSSVLNLSVQWKCIAHNLSLCRLLLNWMSVNGAWERSQHGNALRARPCEIGPHSTWPKQWACVTVWMSYSLSGVVHLYQTMASLCIIYFQRPCVSLGHSYFLRSEPIVLHLHTFSNFGSDICLFCCQLR